VSRPDAGFSILVVVGIVLILTILGLAVATLVVEDADISASQVESSQALYLAHAGIEYAILKVGSNPAWSGLPPPGKSAGAGSFWVAPPDTLDEKGRPLPPGRRRIISTGRVGNSTRVIHVQVAAGTISSIVLNGALPASPRADSSSAPPSAPCGPEGITISRNGDLVFADPANHVVRKVELLTGAITVLVGSGMPGRSGDGGRASAARLLEPCDVCAAPDGDLYIADAGAHVVRRVSGSTGVITTVAGTGSPGGTGDGGPATQARLNAPSGIALGPAGELYIAERRGHRVRRVLLDSGIISTVAGCGLSGYGGDDGKADQARLSAPGGVAVASNGDLYIADTGNHVIRRVAGSTGIITTVAGHGAPGKDGDGGPATAVSLNTPRALAFAPSGDLYIADTENHEIRRLDMASGSLSTIAGRGVPGLGGDGGASTAARLDQPWGVAVSPSGVYFVADRGNHRIRRVGGILSVVAWNEGEV
jgi:sugar lactone lactonase YvrE